MKMKIIKNLTPHAITLCGKTIEPTGLARCAQVSERIGDVDGIPVNKKSFGAVDGLPSPEAGTIYIVSAIVAQAVAGKRDDVYVVDETIRDENGWIVGANALAKV